DRGREGGFALLDGWTMPPTGLTNVETEALLLSGMPGQVRQLGLHAAMLSGQAKLMQTMPQNQRAMIGRISAHVHVDPVSWFGAEEPAKELDVISAAVWNRKKLACTYLSWKGEVKRVLDPLGLVVKGGTWYLAARADGDKRVYRIAKFSRITALDQDFTRPTDFDLASFWQGAVTRYETDIYQGTATLHLTKTGLERLSLLGEPVARAARQSSNGDNDLIVTIPIESIAQASTELLRLGTECTVLQPPELVDAIRQLLVDIGQRYKCQSRTSG
ncbi:MAG: WYL domain-containing protein, partial [Cohaesibacteraceae bacterium]|nr:WYL domain-containing protein [Cohaesibacteraceae bacterium]